MEDNKRRRRRDIVQNIAITVLALSAVLLFAQSQISNFLSDQGALANRLSGSAAGDAVAQTTVLSAPVRVAVTGVYDRYGAYLTTDNETFSDLGLLLKESLGSAEALATCTEEDFVSALDGVSVFYDFLEAHPLSILSGLLGGDDASDEIRARQLVISAGNGGVRLYTWDGDSQYLSCQVPPVSAEDLTELINSCSFGVAVFAFDEAELDPAYAQIAPRSLLLMELPELPVLNAANPLTSTDQLLADLGFNPSTKNRYTDYAAGTETVRETDRSVQIGSDGTVIYQSGSEPAVEISAEEDIPTLREAAGGTAALLQKLMGDLTGEAALYLESITQTGEVTTLRFGYHVDGVPIRFADGGTAAEVTLTGTVVTAMTLRLRQYTDSGETSLLLPLRQALAIAALHPGAELFIGYADSGASVSANWMEE